MTTLNYSEYNIGDSDNNNIVGFEKPKFNTPPKIKNQTIKRKRNVTNLLKTMHVNREEPEEDDNDFSAAYLAKIEIPPPPQMNSLLTQPQPQQTESETDQTQQQFQESFTSNNEYVPYYTGQTYQPVNKDQMMEKMNYMIHLLEEQKDEKSGSVIEELILYGFLGVFMIFMVDSFAKVGRKYTR